MNEGKAAMADANGEEVVESISQLEKDELIAEAVAEGEDINFTEGEEA